MNVSSISQTGVGTSPDVRIIPRPMLHMGFGVVVTGKVTYTVEHTYNGVDYYEHESVVAKTNNADGEYTRPVAGIRLRVTKGKGTATLTSIQAG